MRPKTYKGSKWWKFDFHTHTPKSDDYGRDDKSYKNIEPEAWLKAAMESGIDCVAVTDHNSGGWIDILKSKNKEIQDATTKPDWYREITIFPGVEITVGDSNRRIHLLAIFDPSCESQKITAVLGTCGIYTGFGDSEKTSTTKSFLDTVRIVRDAKGIAILAHIDGSKGLLNGASSLTPEMKKSLDAVSVAEFCNLRAFANAEQSLKKAVEQLAQVGGSDAHQPNEIGQNFSWLKMSHPSLDELQLALLDYDFCLKNQSENPYCEPAVFLSKLAIHSMHHCGKSKDKPFIAQLHPQFNSLIGGRGTGKSTAIESMRIVLRRENEVEPFKKLKNELEKFLQDQSGSKKDRGVMEHDTEILLEIHRNGKNYRLRWRHDGQGAVLDKEIDDNVWQETETGNLKERFKISIFSQKQINELASNPRGLLEVIDRSLEVNRAEWDERWENAKSQFLQSRERERELMRQLDGEEQLRVARADVKNDLKQYEKNGYGEVLKRYQKHSQQSNALPDDQIFDVLSSGIRKLASQAELSDFPSHLFDEQAEDTAEMKAIHERTAQELKKVGETLGKLADSVDKLKVERAKNISASKWYQSGQINIAKYEELLKEHKGESITSMYGELVRRYNQLQQQLKKLDSVRKETEVTGMQIDKSLEKLQQLRKELLEKRKNFLNKVIGTSDFVRMDLVQYGDVSTLEEDYRSLLNLELFESSIFDETRKQGILYELKKWEDLNKSEADLPCLIEKIKSKTFAIANGRESGNHWSFDNRLKKLIKDQPAIFDQLDAWWPEDVLYVKYSKDTASDKFEDLEKGSAGQKAAAILAFLLSYGDEPLIIDQPEDDLDNALIYDLIVKQIHNNKNRRQLIIATHNPNIVVNGDAELVHVLKFEKGQVQIDQQGGLGETIIRKAICNIMEGGHQAFEKRYKRLMREKNV